MRRKRGSESEAFCLMTYLPRGELLKLLNLRWRRKWILSCCCFCSRSPTILKTIETAAMDRGIHGRTVSFEWNFSFECFQGPGIKWNVVRSIPSSTLYDKSVTSAMPVLFLSFVVSLSSRKGSCILSLQGFYGKCWSSCNIPQLKNEPHLPYYKSESFIQFNCQKYWEYCILEVTSFSGLRTECFCRRWSKVLSLKCASFVKLLQHFRRSILDRETKSTRKERKKMKTFCQERKNEPISERLPTWDDTFTVRLISLWRMTMFCVRSSNKSLV